jgi:hypothetical protein
MDSGTAFQLSPVPFKLQKEGIAVETEHTTNEGRSLLRLEGVEF